MLRSSLRPPVIAVTGPANAKPRFPRSPHPSQLFSVIPRSPLHSAWKEEDLAVSESEDGTASSVGDFDLPGTPPAAQAFNLSAPPKKDTLGDRAANPRAGLRPLSIVVPSLGPQSAHVLPSDKQGLGSERTSELIKRRKASPIQSLPTGGGLLREPVSSPRRPDAGIVLRKQTAIRAHAATRRASRANFAARLSEAPSRSAVMIGTPVTPPDSPAEFHFSLPSPGLRSPLSAFDEEGFNLKDEVEKINWAETLADQKARGGLRPSAPSSPSTDTFDKSATSIQMFVTPPKRMQSLHALQSVLGARTSKGPVSPAPQKTNMPTLGDITTKLAIHHAPPARSSFEQIPPLPVLPLNLSRNRNPMTLRKKSDGALDSEAVSKAFAVEAKEVERAQRSAAMVARLGLRRRSASEAEQSPTVQAAKIEQGALF